MNLQTEKDHVSWAVRQTKCFKRQSSSHSVNELSKFAWCRVTCQIQFVRVQGSPFLLINKTINVSDIQFLRNLICTQAKHFKFLFYFLIQILSGKGCSVPRPEHEVHICVCVYVTARFSLQSSLILGLGLSVRQQCFLRSYSSCQVNSQPKPRNVCARE